MPARDPKSLADWMELDYHRRPRPFSRAQRLGVVVAVAFGLGFVGASLRPRNHMMFQAGPVAAVHAGFGHDCRKCHDEPLRTALRILPAFADIHATSDTACLSCHPAGEHNPRQTMFVNPAHDQSADCAGCHREHRGRSLVRIDDTHCTQCHENLTVRDGAPRFHRRVTAFVTDHPEFGAWRGGGLKDPGTLRFNHARHLALPKETRLEAARPWLAEPLRKLRTNECLACHEPDADGRYMKPVSYNDHCKACHELRVPSLVGGLTDPNQIAAEREINKHPLRHPGPGENAEKVRGELLERFFAFVAATGYSPDKPSDPPARPHLLERRTLTPAQKRFLDGRLTEVERQLFDPLRHESLVFDKTGCAYCHREESRDNGLPKYAAPRLTNRWDGAFPAPRVRPGPQRDRWYPYARFNHHSHRAMACVDCHTTRDGTPVSASSRTDDLLIPAKENCVTCHRPAGTARSECLECHTYHDHGRDIRGARPLTTDRGGE